MTYPNSYSIFQDAAKKEAIDKVCDSMKGQTIRAVEIEDYTITIHTYGKKFVFQYWASYADDQALDIDINGEAIVKDYYEFIGPNRPPRTEEEEKAYRASLSGYQGLMYDEMQKIAAQLNNSLVLMKLRADE